MTIETRPPLRRVRLAAAYLKQTDQVPAAAEAIRDEKGDLIRDEQGRPIYAG